MSGVADGIGMTWQPDGDVHYRTDEFGALIAALPTRCPTARHDLPQVGYQAREKDGIVYVSCNACRAVPRPEHQWSLRTGGKRPTRAEFDHQPYTQLATTLQQRHTH